MKTVNFTLDPDSKIRLYFQLYSKFAQQIDSGELPAGTKLPSVRLLSEQLNISRNTVTKAYEQLELDGYITSQEKRGYFTCNPDGSSPQKQTQSDEIPTVDSIISSHKDTMPQIPEWKEISDTLSIPSEEELLPDPKATFTNPEEEIDHTLAPQEPHLQQAENLEELPVPASDSQLSQELPDTPVTAYMDQQENSPYEQQQNSPEGSSFEGTQTSESILGITPSLPENPKPAEQTINDLILDSYKTLLSSSSSNLNKFPDPMGETELKNAICSFLKDFRNIDALPQNIIVSSNIQTLIKNILDLPSIKKITIQPQDQTFSSQNQTPQSEPSKEKQVHGLLQKAENVNAAHASIVAHAENAADSTAHVTAHTAASTENISSPASQKPTVPTLAFVEGSCERPDEVFPGINFPVKKITSSEKQNLLTSNATIAYVSPFDSALKFVENIDSHRQNLLDWAAEKSYRYIMEYDASTQSSNNLSFKCFDTRDKVIYLASFSVLISGGINGAWTVLPESLAKEYKHQYMNYDCPLSLLDQMFLKDFIESGNLKKHLDHLSGFAGI